MCAGQGELGGIVIERRRQPPGSGVAKRAVGGEPTRNVRRIGGAVEVCLVTREACRWGVAVIVVGMALSARHGGVLSGQRIVRVQSVIELGIRPI